MHYVLAELHYYFVSFCFSFFLFTSGNGIAHLPGVLSLLSCQFSEKECLLDLKRALLDSFQELMCTFDAAGRNVEVAFCFDTTGSMYSCLNTVSRVKINK